MGRKLSDTRYIFKVNLKGAKRVWRTVVLRGDHTLHDLPKVIYKAFDRYDEHLYSFYFPRAVTRRDKFDLQPKEYTAPFVLEEPDPFSDQKCFNAAKTTLDSLRLKVDQTFEYLFDFGDSWLHELRVVAKEPLDRRKKLPKVAERHGDSPEQYPLEEE